MTDITYAPEVLDAKKNGAPIVALESTIITHGMPWPRNYETALQVHEAVQANGATPATMAVLEGRLHVGLTEGALETLAQAKDVAKLSRADLATCVATGGTGATTVAATMIMARLAGIDVFATGGIGGVHRGADQSFDISADLQELAQTPVTVVCAGAKAILDLPKTFEVLETLGVPVIAFGQDTLPAFWSASSPLAAPLRMDEPEEIARAHLVRKCLGIPGGQLIANPIPQAAEIPARELTPLIEASISEADARGISGKDVTPWLLSRIFDKTNGRSLTANIALVLNNAALASRIACRIERLDGEISPTNR